MIRGGAAHGDQCVVPRLAPGRFCRPSADRSFGHDVVQERVDGTWLVAQPQRDMCNVHTEVSHHPDVTAGLNPTLPVDGFGSIDIGRVQKV